MNPNVFKTHAIARYASKCLQHRCYGTLWIHMSSTQMLWNTMKPNVFKTHAMAHYESKCLHNTYYGTPWIQMSSKHMLWHAMNPQSSSRLHLEAAESNPGRGRECFPQSVHSQSLQWHSANANASCFEFLFHGQISLQVRVPIAPVQACAGAS